MKDISGDPVKDVKADVKTKINLDTILLTEIGQFGKFQLRTLLLTAVIALFTALGASEYVFTTARISSRCVIPECDASEPEWSPYWLSNAVPATDSGTFDNCQRYGNATDVSRLVESDTCPSTLFDRNTLEECDRYVYQNTHSVAYDMKTPKAVHSLAHSVPVITSQTFIFCWFILLFDLACDEWRRSLIGTVRTFGTLTALPITGYVSDRWGRRIALSISVVNRAWLGLTRYWANTYIGFMMLEFAEATFGSGAFTSAYILLMELVGPQYRVVVGASMNTFFAIGQVLTGLIAWGVPNWRHFTLTLYIPQLLTISYYWLISESVRWYMSKGRFDDSEALLKKVAKINGKQLSDKSLQALRATAEEEAKLKALENKHSNKDPWLIVQVFRHKPILLRCIISPMWWVTTTFIYYGLSINSVNMSGNRYLNYVAVSAVEIPGYWIAVFLMGRIGRKPVLIGGYWICAACQIAYMFMPQNLYAVSLTVYLIAKFSIAMVLAAVYVYTAELYPTKHRHSLFAYSSMIGRIGSMTAPLTPAIGAQWFEELPFVLFALFAFVSGMLIFLTPETLGSKLPDTLEEASQIGRKENNVDKR